MSTVIKNKVKEVIELYDMKTMEEARDAVKDQRKGVRQGDF